MDDLNSAPEEAAIAGRRCRLEAELWLDRMPIRKERPLIARLQVVAVDGGLNLVLEGLTADQLWVIRDKEVWASSLISTSAGDRKSVV